MKHRISSSFLLNLAFALTFITTLTGFRAAQALPGEFTALANSPVALTAVTVDPNTGLIYAQENGEEPGIGFYSYNPATDTWTILASALIMSDNNGGAAYANGKIYTVYTENSAQMGVYDIATDTWSTTSNPLGQGTGNITSVGNDLYLAVGNTFIRHNVVSNTTTTLASPPFAFEEWGGLEPWGPYIYAHQGDGSKGFALYNTLNNTWKKLPNIPEGAIHGSAIDTDNGFYYAYGPYNGNKLFVYNLYANTWSTISIPTFSTINDGGMVYINTDGYEGLYFVQGEIGSGFARFESYPFSHFGASVNGNGTLANTSGKIKASFFGAYNSNGLGGSIVWTDKVNNMTFQSTTIISIETTSDQATLYGVGKVNGVDGYNFVLTAEDNAPSFIAQGDGVSLQINNGWYNFSGYFNPGDIKVIPGLVL